MAREIRTFLPLSGDPAVCAAVLRTTPDRWLADAISCDDGRWQLAVQLGSLSCPVVARVGQPWQLGATVWRTLSWDPTARRIERWLPAFDGEIGVHLGATAATLLLDGRYVPPGQQVGRLLDTVALHRAARATVTTLAQAVAARLRQQAQADVRA